MQSAAQCISLSIMPIAHDSGRACCYSDHYFGISSHDQKPKQSVNSDDMQDLEISSMIQRQVDAIVDLE